MVASRSPSVSLALWKEQGQAGGRLLSLKHVHPWALLVRWAGSVHVPTTPASSPDAPGQGRRTWPGWRSCWPPLALRPWAEARLAGRGYGRSAGTWLIG